MKKIICTAALFCLITAVPGFCGELDDLFSSVAALNIQRNGYTLCAELTPEQKAHAEKHMDAATSKKVYRFLDKTLNIVADTVTHRVLVMFEQFENIGQEDVRKLVGDLFMAYGDPTVSAHDRVVYWAWGKREKFTSDQYETAREKKRTLDIIATVKFNSEVSIREDSESKPTGNAYYIISSEPLLQFFKDD